MARARIKPLESYAEVARTSGMKRTLGGLQLAMLGLSTIVGTGIFILVAEAAQRAGPAMLLSFILAGAVCGAAALCYAELASIAPVAGGSYAFAYVSFGEVAAWMVGCALLAEYILGASAISVGWSSYVVFFVESLHQSAPWFPVIDIPASLSQGYFGGGLINLPAALIVLLVTALLIIGTRVSVSFAIGLMVLKLAALGAFIVLALPAIDLGNFRPFAPLGTAGVATAAASVFFAYLGFDGLASAAEETREPQRNVPIGVLGAVGIATLLYVTVVIAAVGAVGGQPVAANGRILAPATAEFAAHCASLEQAGAQPLACSQQAIAYVLTALGHPGAASMIAVIVFLALPAAVVATLYAQSRLLFAMARDGLLPQRFSTVHPRLKTPVAMIAVTGTIVMVTAALFPIGRLADVANGGTLFAFFMAAAALLILRRRHPHLQRPFRLKAAYPVAGFAAAGCLLLFFKLPAQTLIAFAAWLALGLVFYAAYGARRSIMALDHPSRSRGEE